MQLIVQLSMLVFVGAGLLTIVSLNAGGYLGVGAALYCFGPVTVISGVLWAVAFFARRKRLH